MSSQAQTQVVPQDDRCPLPGRHGVERGPQAHPLVGRTDRIPYVTSGMASPADRSRRQGRRVSSIAAR